MSHFYGTLQGSRGEASRCGTKSSGVETYAAGWGGAIRTVLFHRDGRDMFRVEMVEWRGAGDYLVLAEGVVGDAFSVMDCYDHAVQRAASHGDFLHDQAAGR